MLGPAARLVLLHELPFDIGGWRSQFSGKCIAYCSQAFLRIGAIGFLKRIGDVACGVGEDHSLGCFFRDFRGLSVHAYL